jgi:GST-like protein
MIDLYTWTTPNGRKVSILLEELGLDYATHAIDITRGEQNTPAFRAVSPNAKIPAITDSETGFSLMESGAILLYLSEKHKVFLPEGLNRWRTIEWLMWQMGGAGPMLGQAHHFLKHNKGKAPYAEDRFHTEALRLYGVLNDRLRNRDYVADSYSIADMAIWPWISRFAWQQVELVDFPQVRDWYLRIADRPAVQRGYHVPHFVNEIPMP